MARKDSEMSSLFTLCLVLVLGYCLLFFALSEAQKVPAVYVFGDSLLDVGNNNHLKLSTAKADFPHNGIDYPGKKPTGRFSNGKNTADFLAEKVGLLTSPPYLSLKSNSFPITGVSFASGGAGIFNSTDKLFKQSIALSKQVEYYSNVYQALVKQLGSAGAQTHLSKSLFVIWIGSNDLLGYFNRGSDVSKKIAPQVYVDSMVVDLKEELKQIHSNGARKFAVVGVGAVGCCPAQRNQIKNGECNQEANYWSDKYNQGLKSMLQGLKSELKDFFYSYIDTYSVFTHLIQNPTTNGFADVKAACCGLGNLRARVPCVPLSTYCANRSNHIFWDLYHPTEAADRTFVDTVFDGSQLYAMPSINQLIAD